MLDIINLQNLRIIVQYAHHMQVLIKRVTLTPDQITGAILLQIMNPYFSSYLLCFLSIQVVL